MTYSPSKPPSVSSQDAQALAAYLTDELQVLASSLRTVDSTLYSASNAAPIRPRTGTVVYADGTNWNPGAGEGLYVYSAAGSWVWLEAPALPKGQIFGLTLSTAGSSSTFGIAAGEAADSTGVASMKLASAYTKTTSIWAQGSGNGALDTGAIANSTWYHAHLIEKTDKSAVDVTVSLSATTPTLQSGWTFARRLGAMKTNGSAQWWKFVQDGDVFQWDVPVQDVNAVNNPGTAAVTRTLTVPTGVRVKALISAAAQSNGSVATPGAFYISDLSVADTTAGNGAFTVYTYSSLAQTLVSAAPGEVFTNTSAQVRTRLATSNADAYIYINTNGWIDTRGRNA